MSTTENNPDAEEWVDPYPKKKRQWMGWIVVPVLLLTLYVLSAGPLVRLAEQSKISWATFTTIYAPLLLVEHVPPFDYAIHWYVDLWRIEYLGPPTQP